MTEQDKHTGLRQVADKAQDMAGAAVGRVSANTMGSVNDTSFVNNAAQGDMLEIAAAEHMLAHSRNEKVREAASRMIDDHRALTHHMRSALRSSETPDDLSEPDGLDARRQKLLEHLMKAPAEDKDKLYLEQQVAAHQETLDLMEGYADHGPNAQLRSVAMGAAPLVARHLDHMKGLYRSCS